MLQQDIVEFVLLNYFKQKRMGNEEVFDSILKENDFCFETSVRNAIYELLSLKRTNNVHTPADWPGIGSIKDNGILFELRTAVGDIQVYKANAIFGKSDSSWIFQKELIGQCYARTYDFVKENRDYKAILMDMPYFLGGCHYHAFASNDHSVVDIASNAYYEEIEFAKKILKGKFIKELSYEEIEDEFWQLCETIPDMTGKEDKLHVLTLYNDFMNRGKL